MHERITEECRTEDRYAEKRKYARFLCMKMRVIFVVLLTISHELCR